MVYVVDGYELSEAEKKRFTRYRDEITSKHIEDNRHYLFKKLGYDPGLEFAEMDFVDNYAEHEAKETTRIALERVLEERALEEQTKKLINQFIKNFYMPV